MMDLNVSVPSKMPAAFSSHLSQKKKALTREGRRRSLWPCFSAAEVPSHWRRRRKMSGGGGGGGVISPHRLMLVAVASCLFPLALLLPGTCPNFPYSHLVFPSQLSHVSYFLSWWTWPRWESPPPSGCLPRRIWKCNYTQCFEFLKGFHWLQLYRYWCFESLCSALSTTRSPSSPGSIRWRRAEE